MRRTAYERRGLNFNLSMNQRTTPEEKREYRRWGEAYRYFAMAARSLQKRALIHFST